MAHESFEDNEVAKLMNAAFISIKVDREERPDIDQIYMTVCQMLTGSGGWPLTIVMTPSKLPFFAGTYIPKESRFGRLGMLDFIPQIEKIWRTRRGETLDRANRITASLQQISEYSPGGDLDESILKVTFEEFTQRFDKHNGGFGTAPKFPMPHNLLFLLRYWKRSGNEHALNMVETTLQSMRGGGIYDHLGFGFHRYSTDAEWLLPHFEKMLYDQALLALTYLEAYQATQREEYEKTAREIFTYVLRDLAAENGGFYSGEDADVDGEEGRFYLWTSDEIHKGLGKEEANLVIEVFDVQENGNFAEETTGRSTGRNILHLKTPYADLASQRGISERELCESLSAAIDKLFLMREKRTHPFKDDKILTDWNGLMIAALARGAQVFYEPEYLEAAKRASDFILRRMRVPDGRLLHRYRDGETGIQANLDDYAFLIWGLIELYEAGFDVNHLKTAIDLNRDLMTHFWDHEKGGFWFTPDDGESLILRRKQAVDGAIPSGNSVAMLNLLRIGRITANADYEGKAARIIQAFSSRVKQSPTAFTQLMISLDFAAGPSYELVIAGRTGAKDTREMLRTLWSHFIPNKITLFRPTEQQSPEITHIAEYTEYMSGIDGKATAYVCIDHACDLPTTDSNKMLDLLDV
jgi:uncharacterized protein YyaL (SSP411 family)